MLKNIRDNFVKELTLASQGKKTSLAFIKNPIPQKPLVEDGEIFQVMVIGASILEKALVCKKRNKIIILSKQNEVLPLFKTKKIFFFFFEKHVDPKVKFIGLNFAFPLEPKQRNGVLDGILIRSTKEHQFDGLLNELVGEGLENSLVLNSNRSIKVAVANDAVCLLLAGLQMEKWKKIAGGIIGTGTNLCFFPDKNTVVNLESGNFNKFKNTGTGKRINKQSTEIDAYLFEKEVAGAYLFQHYNFLMKPLKLTGQPLCSTQELSKLAEKNIENESLTARKLFKRSASLAACQIAGIYHFLEHDQLTFIMEGTLFWEGWKYREMVENYLEKLDVPQYGVKFKHIENSGISGGARIVVGN